MQDKTNKNPINSEIRQKYKKKVKQKKQLSFAKKSTKKLKKSQDLSKSSSSSKLVALTDDQFIVTSQLSSSDNKNSNNTFCAKKLTDKDYQVLEDFCNSFDYDEISFDTFCEINKISDVYLSLKLSESECAAGGKTKLSFVRKVKNKCSIDDSVFVEKVRVDIVIKWPKGSKVGDQIIVCEQGDKDIHDSYGDLIVTIVK